jgi:hypothetical protein
MLNGMQKNQVQSYESRDQRRYLTIGQAGVLKLDSWLARVKRGETCSDEINKEAARIKVLDSTEHTKVIDDISYYVKDF